MELAMPDWLPMVLAGAAGALIGMYLFRPRRRRPEPQPPLFADDREERVAHQVARAVGCRVELALPAVRHEIDLAPHQSDDVLVKRAAYHYRQNLPEGACPVYRDRSRG
jgi:hypothetical protein